mmetsp:Transcript_16106/g.34897  ORF Transcript_16106/g.34897 Transcript_16106/m.34897 type:complete len:173 (-) Transcript_16106:211-729(-)
MLDPIRSETAEIKSYSQLRRNNQSARGRLPVRCMQEASFGRALRERDHAPSPRMECRMGRPTPLAHIAVHENVGTSSASPSHRVMSSLSTAPVIGNSTPRRMRCTPIHSPGTCATPTRKSCSTPRPALIADHCTGVSQQSSSKSASPSPEQQEAHPHPPLSEKSASTCPPHE